MKVMDCGIHVKVYAFTDQTLFICDDRRLRPNHGTGKLLLQTLQASIQKYRENGRAYNQLAIRSKQIQFSWLVIINF